MAISEGMRKGYEKRYLGGEMEKGKAKEPDMMAEDMPSLVAELEDHMTGMQEVLDKLKGKASPMEETPGKESPMPEGGTEE